MDRVPVLEAVLAQEVLILQDSSRVDQALAVGREVAVARLDERLELENGGGGGNGDGELGLHVKDDQLCPVPLSPLKRTSCGPLTLMDRDGDSVDVDIGSRRTKRAGCSGVD